MKKYILFGYCKYYPIGGLNDIQGEFDTLKKVIEYMNKPKYRMNYWQILDRDKWEVISYHVDDLGKYILKKSI